MTAIILIDDDNNGGYDDGVECISIIFTLFTIQGYMVTSLIEVTGNIFRIEEEEDESE